MTGPAVGGPAARPLWSLARQRLRAERRLFLRTTATALVLALLGVATAASSVLATTAVVRDDPGAAWLVVPAAAAALALGALSWHDSWLAHLLAYRVIDAIRLDVHAALAALAPLGLGRRRSGETASAAMADAETLEWFYAHTAAQLVAGAAAATTLSATAVAWLGLPGLLLPVAQVFLLATVVPLRRRARRQGEELRAALSALSAETVEARQAARELVLLGRVDVHRAAVRALTSGVQRVRRGHAVRAGLEQAAAEAVTALVAVAGLVALAAAVSAGTLDPGLLPVALVGLLAGLAPVLLVVTALQRIGEMTAAAGRLSEILTAGDTARDRPSDRAAAAAAPSGDDGLELTGVRYTYPGTDREVLRGLDLVVAPGEHVAVVGASGAGKTTLLHLLVRLLEPTAGSLRLAGLDAGAPPAAARERVTLVGQHPHVFRDTVRGNLLLAAPRPDEVDDDQVRAALADAGLAAVVAALPGGLDAPLAEHGATWSGGQRQRLGLARGLLRDPAVLVLDEPTANLDAETEQGFLDTVARQRAGRTTVVVSHRASTIARFDRVVLLDAGRVVADGSHAELLATEPRYAEVLAAEPGERPQ